LKIGELVFQICFEVDANGILHCGRKDKVQSPLFRLTFFLGGTKFSGEGLIFKYPVDTLIDKKNKLWLYGHYTANDITAAKASNHDLKDTARVFPPDGSCVNKDDSPPGSVTFRKYKNY